MPQVTPMKYMKYICICLSCWRNSKASPCYGTSVGQPCMPPPAPRPQVDELSVVADKYRGTLEENRRLYNEVQDLKGNIRVFCRVRPPGATGDATPSAPPAGPLPARCARHACRVRPLCRLPLCGKVARWLQPAHSQLRASPLLQRRAHGAFKVGCMRVHRARPVTQVP
jgi:hypothetical protein